MEEQRLREDLNGDIDQGVIEEHEKPFASGAKPGLRLDDGAGGRYKTHHIK